MAGKPRSDPVSIDQLHLDGRVAVGAVRVPALRQIHERFAVKLDVMPLDIELAQSARAQFGGAAASQSGQDHHRVVRDFLSPLNHRQTVLRSTFSNEANSVWLCASRAFSHPRAPLWSLPSPKFRSWRAHSNWPY
jgi:hypothetical protein